MFFIADEERGEGFAVISADQQIVRAFFLGAGAGADDLIAMLEGKGSAIPVGDFLGAKHLEAKNVRSQIEAFFIRAERHRFQVVSFGFGKRFALLDAELWRIGIAIFVYFVADLLEEDHIECADARSDRDRSRCGFVALNGEAHLMLASGDDEPASGLDVFQSTRDELFSGNVDVAWLIARHEIGDIEETLFLLSLNEWQRAKRETEDQEAMKIGSRVHDMLTWSFWTTRGLA